MKDLKIYVARILGDLVYVKAEGEYSARKAFRILGGGDFDGNVIETKIYSKNIKDLEVAE